ncbi:hypothetical protein LEMLEM_LOCUS904 [Lemmus lemmus]
MWEQAASPESSQSQAETAAGPRAVAGPRPGDTGGPCRVRSWLLQRAAIRYNEENTEIKTSVRKKKKQDKRVPDIWCCFTDDLEPGPVLFCCDCI